MPHTKLAPFAPFSGAPSINLPTAYGASPKKPFLLRIPVTGKRPLTLDVKGLPDGLVLDGFIIRGIVAEAGNYPITICASNEEGSDCKTVVFEIADGSILLYPLLGYTSWNDRAWLVTQEDILNAADALDRMGFAEYGYAYVNTDSSWQGAYGGEFDAIMPNEKFPDMKGMCDALHQKGFKAGIYSTPMLRAWGCPPGHAPLPGCTVGEPDIHFADTNTGIGMDRREKNNVAQWSAWGFDYLKYDWSPTDPYNAEEMYQCLHSAPRDFGYCVTVRALPECQSYWRTRVQSYRSNPDCDGRWCVVLTILDSYNSFRRNVVRGHYFDLDMLDIGVSTLMPQKGHYTDDEEIFIYSMRVLLSSPIQISCHFNELTDTECAILGNEEVIAVSQDFAGRSAYPFCWDEKDGHCVVAYRRPLSDGSFAVGVFNRGDTNADFTFDVDSVCRIRDIWAKEDLCTDDHLTMYLTAHSARLFRLYPQNQKGL